ncbi:MAG: hypothetical protein J6B81_02345 [Spirochaetaceae bacterium]|nr:hypothetical protein [Spirochaetaceae bacterium]
MKKTGSPIDGYEDGEEVLVYHYGKAGERLKNANQEVKRFYEEINSNKGLFYWLLKTNTSKFLIITIIVLIIIIMITSLVGNKNNSGVINNVDVNLAAFSFAETVYASVRIAPSEIDKSVPVTCQVKVFSQNKQLVNSENIVQFYTGDELFLRTSFSDYDIIYVEADVSFLDKTITLSCNVSKN